MEELQQHEALLDEQLLAEPDSELLSDEEGEEGGLQSQATGLHPGRDALSASRQLAHSAGYSA